mgnify:CR=1 FL=1
MAEKRILFTGGGTAGHVIVNLALIPFFKKEGWQIDYIGSIDGIERELISDLEGVTYHPISTGKLRRYMSLENIKDPFRVLKGTFQAWKIIRKIKPHVLFSKGGFVSVPVVFAAKMLRVPTIIHESDYTPGLANKLSVPFANRVLTTFPETVKYLPDKKTEYIGAVVRNELFEGDKQKGYAFTGLTKDKPVLLIMGGSSGSEKINEAVRSNLDELLKEFQIVHLCGIGKLDDSINRKGYVQFEYVKEELADIFAITDFIVSRAGANAIFEFLALNIPMLLIPLSEAASRGDQIVNANSFKESGFAHVLKEEELTNDSFIKEINHLQQYGAMYKDRMKQYESAEARDKIIEIIQSLSRTY